MKYTKNRQANIEVVLDRSNRIRMRLNFHQSKTPY